MCGLAGILSWRALGAESSPELARMSATLSHRGPDDEGFWSDAQAGIALASRRLSIIELSPLGHMPMHSPSGRYVIAYNGEIYNFGELRQRLAQEGCAFRGRSDTEVLLAAIETWGLDEALRCVVGMFAFALWDCRARTLVLCRDRMGEKPLYWARCGDMLLFGSELKALRVHPAWQGGVDRSALALLLRLGYIPAPYTIHPGARKVMPGTYLSFAHGEREPRESRYWDLRAIVQSGSEAGLELEEATDRLEAALRTAVRGQMVADVRVGAFLSGGIDSSLITALMQEESARPVKTFTVGFREAEFDEAKHARAVAAHLGTDHTELLVTPAEAMTVVPRLHETYDEPFADSSQIPTMLVASLARRRVTVCLSGDGGDDLFAGYTRYHWGVAAMDVLDRMPGPVKYLASVGIAAMPTGFWNGAARVAQPLLPERLHAPQFEPKLRVVGDMLGAPGAQAFYRSQLSYWRQPERVVRGASEAPTALSDPRAWLALPHRISSMMYADQVTYLPDDILVKVDRASMAASLELRAPFLDHRVVELAWKIPIALKLGDGGGKRILKHLLARRVPRQLTERPKQGFGIPVGAWLRGPLRGWAEDLLARPRLVADGYLDPEAVQRMWQRHLCTGEDYGLVLWPVLMFQQWLAVERRA